MCLMCIYHDQIYGMPSSLTLLSTADPLAYLDAMPEMELTTHQFDINAIIKFRAEYKRTFKVTLNNIKSIKSPTFTK